MYIGDINFDYSGMYEYKSYSPPCKADFTVYGSFEEITNLKIFLKEHICNQEIMNWQMIFLKVMFDKLRGKPFMPINTFDYGSFNYSTTTKLLGYCTPVEIPPIKKVIFHDPATIVYWQDKTRTVVKCKDDETFDKEKGLAMCISKKLLGDEFHSEFKKYIEDKEK